MTGYARRPLVPRAELLERRTLLSTVAASMPRSGATPLVAVIESRRHDLRAAALGCGAIGLREEITLAMTQAAGRMAAAGATSPPRVGRSAPAAQANHLAVAGGVRHPHVNPGEVRVQSVLSHAAHSVGNAVSGAVGRLRPTLSKLLTTVTKAIDNGGHAIKKVVKEIASSAEKLATKIQAALLIPIPSIDQLVQILGEIRRGDWAALIPGILDGTLGFAQVSDDYDQVLQGLDDRYGGGNVFLASHGFYDFMSPETLAADGVAAVASAGLSVPITAADIQAHVEAELAALGLWLGAHGVADTGSVIADVLSGKAVQTPQFTIKWPHVHYRYQASILFGALRPSITLDHLGFAVTLTGGNGPDPGPVFRASGTVVSTPVIQSLANNELVTGSMTVEGQVPVGTWPVVLVRPLRVALGDGAPLDSWPYWVQPAVSEVDADGRFTLASVYFGEGPEEITPPGTPFQFLVLALPSQDATLSYSEGLKLEDLPAFPHSDPITVIRA